MGSKVSVTQVRIVDQPKPGPDLPSWKPVSVSEVITSGVAAQRTTLTAAAEGETDPVTKYLWRVAVLGSTPVHIRTSEDGADLATAADPGVPGGYVEYLPITAFGDALSVIDA